MPIRARLESLAAVGECAARPFGTLPESPSIYALAHTSYQASRQKGPTIFLGGVFSVVPRKALRLADWLRRRLNERLDILLGTMQDSFSALRSAMRGLMVGALNYLGNFDLPVRQIMFPEFTGWTMSQGTSRLVLDARWSTSALLRSWENWPQFLAVLEIVRSDSMLRDVMLTDAAGQPVNDDYAPHALDVPVSQFLMDYIHEVGRQRAVWDDMIFARLINLFIESLQRGSYLQVLWTPLYDCDASSLDRPVDIGGGSVLIEPDENTRVKLLPTWSLESPHYQPARHYLCLKENVPFHKHLSPEGQAVSRRCATAIRLAVGGYTYVQETRILTEPGECHPMGAFGGISIGFPASPWRFPGTPSVVTLNDIERTRKFAESIPLLEKEFPIALSRFYSTSERQNPADRLIDASIGLENLLLQGIRDELAFRFALRGAWLLAETASARIEDYKQLQRVYRERSDVVHGNPKAVTAPKPEIVNGAVDLLRRVLGKAATMQTTASNWKLLVDRVVFGTEEEAEATQQG